MNPYTEQDAFEAYMTALSDKQYCWLRHREAWRAHVLENSEETFQQWNASMEEMPALEDQEERAYRQWQRIAYPIRGFPIPQAGIAVA